MAWYDDNPYKTVVHGYNVTGQVAPSRKIYPSSVNLVLDEYTMSTDGWLVYAALQGGRSAPPGASDMRARLCLWDHAGSVLHVSPLDATIGRWWDGFYSWRQVEWNRVSDVRAASSLRVKKGQVRYLGWLLPDGHVDFAAAAIGATFQTHYYRSLPSYSPPEGGFGTLTRTWDGNLFGRIVVVENQTPLQGTWRFTAPSGEINTTTPLLEGTLPHPAGDRELDYTAAVHMQIFDTATGQTVYSNYWRDISSTEQGQGYFSRNLPSGVLEPGKTYQARFRHEDSHGALSAMSEYTEFETAGGPSPPGLIAPSGKQDELSGYTYSGVYTHPSEVQAKAVEIEVYNASGTTRIHNQSFPSTLANNQIFEIAEWHADLSYGTSYTWRARTQDTNDLWSAWSSLVSFRTNAFPSAPYAHEPSGGRSLATPDFSCVIKDPDQDEIVAAEIEIMDAATNQVLAFYPAAMSVSFDPASSAYLATYSADPAAFTVGGSYRWRARGSDPVGYGAWSGYHAFEVSDAPEVEILSPSPKARVNLIPEPSAETAGSFWSFENQTATNYITRESAAPNAAYGDYVWRAVSTASSSSRMKGAAQEVDSSKDYFLALESRSLSGAPSGKVEVLCYDVGGALLGTLIALDAISPPETWEHHSALVQAEGEAGVSFPVGTTSAALRIYPSTTAAEVEIDGVQFEPTTYGAGLPLSLRQGLTAWLGYFDGSSRNFAPELGDSYAWQGEAHLSPSNGRSVLRSLPTTALISYSSSSSAKEADRVVLEVWDGKRWQTVRRSGWVESDRTEIPLEVGSLENESRARLSIEVRAVSGAVGRAELAEFDVYLAGPPELTILDASPDVVNGSLALTFSESTLEPEDFAGIDVAIEMGNDRTLYRLTDPNATSFVYHFPISGVEYRMMVRQVGFEDATEAQGRWAEALVTCDYAPLNFIKDTENPEQAVAFQITKGDPHSPERKVGGAEFEPWGRRTPIGYKSQMRYDSGETSVQLFDEPHRGLPSAMERYRTLTRMLDEAGTICLLTQRPEPAKTFVYLPDSYRRSHLAPGYPNVSFSWKETEFAEGTAKQTREAHAH